MSSLDETQSTSVGQFAADWESWHREHELQRSSPHGFLSITGMHWLTDKPEHFDDVPGRWSSDVHGVRVVFDEDETLVIDGVLVSGNYDFGQVDEQGVRAAFGDSVVEVCRRDEQFMIRPRDPNNEVRIRYHGTPTYPASIEWVVKGRFVPYDEPRSITVDASVEGLAHVFASSGEVEFEVSGQTLRLIAFNDEQNDELSFIFTDLTTGVTTYAACRFLTVRATDNDGGVDLDFNRATNPPCAYTAFATCPLAPAGNNLPVRIEAGERAPDQSL